MKFQQPYYHSLFPKKKYKFEFITNIFDLDGMSTITTLESKEHVPIRLLSGDHANAVISNLWSWNSQSFLKAESSEYLNILILPRRNSQIVNLSNADAKSSPLGDHYK
jgi:hypothetical protein